jgi:hypothetical protein
MADTTWATTDDVADLTGVTVEQATVNQAAAIIAQKCGAIEAQAVGKINSRDLYWLGQAVAFQAAWMVSQPDVFGRLDATDVMDGRAQHVALKPDANVLAPLAKGALKRLSWRGSRSVKLLSPTQVASGGNWGGEFLDDHLRWRPI